MCPEFQKMAEIDTSGFEKRYSAKLLLFGEYVVIRGGQALAIPYGRYYGQWKLSQETNVSNSTLGKLVEYYEGEPGIRKLIDLERLSRDVGGGLYFESSIPLGYGVGSSGALCAALYDRYALRDHVTDFGELQSVFQLLESYFHGKSSGLDPLVCYLNHPILTNGSVITEKQIPEFTGTGGAVFLLNTGEQRQTAPLVQLFNEKCLDKDYINHIDQELVTSNNNCIQAYLNSDKESLYDNWSQISSIQHQYFNEMIPNLLLKHWMNGVNNQEYSIKLCGAGGGGFLLGITKDYNLTKRVFKNWKLTILHEI